jgi:hypothetical protein
MSTTEFADSITPERVEYAHGLAQRRCEEGKQGFADIGWRAARARDAKLLKALEKGAEIIGKMSEAQMGQTRRGATVDFALTKEHTESQMWREAYRTCDAGDPTIQLSYIYGAAAYLCGYQL